MSVWCLRGLCCWVAVSAAACGGGVAVDPARSTVVVDRTTAVADGIEPAIINVAVRDAQGKPVQGAEVTFAASGTGNSELPGFTTPHGGTGEVRLHTTVAEEKTVTVTVTLKGAAVVLNDKPKVLFRSGPSAGVEFVQQPTTVQAGQRISPPVTLRTVDQYGNASVEPLTVSLRLVRSTGGTLTGGLAQPSSDGGVAFPALIIDRAQTGYALRAELPSGAARESSLFDVTVGPPAQATSTLTAMPVNVQADNVATTTLTVTVKDLGGNPLGSQPVALSVSGTGNTLGASSGTTTAAGTFSTTLRSSVAEAKTVTATSGSLTLTAQVTFVP